jgi:quinol monooxygenase YgiN
MKPGSRIRVIRGRMDSSWRMEFASGVTTNIAGQLAGYCGRLNADRRPIHKQGPIMITEIAQIDVKPGTETEFEKGVQQAIPIFRRAKGCRSMELRRSIEKPARYRLFVGWDTVENHAVDFRGSADFQEWRKLVAHCFASPPDVEHVNQVVSGF